MTRTWRRRLVAALFICNAGAAQAATDSARPCEREMARAAQQHGIPLGILYAVGLTETGRRGALYPYALGADGQTVFAKDMSDAIANFEAMRAKGIKLIDLGCMQINHYYHGDKFASVQAMFDPAKNVEYAARFLKELKQREEAGQWRWPATMRAPTTNPRRSAMSATSSPISSRAASARGPTRRARSVSRKRPDNMKLCMVPYHQPRASKSPHCNCNLPKEPNS